MAHMLLGLREGKWSVRVVLRASAAVAGCTHQLGRLGMYEYVGKQDRTPVCHSKIMVSCVVRPQGGGGEVAYFG